MPLGEVVLDQVGHRLWGQVKGGKIRLGRGRPLRLLLAFHRFYTVATAGAHRRPFVDLVKDLKHVLMRLFQAQLLRDLVQGKVYVTLQAANNLQAHVEVECVLLAYAEEERNLSACVALDLAKLISLGNRLDFLP